MRAFRRLALCCALFSACLAGCTANSPAPEPAGAAGELPRAQLAAALPSLAAVGAWLDAQRQGSFTLAEGHKDGSAYDGGLYHDNVVASAPQLIFTPTWEAGAGGLDGLAVAIYSFDLPAYVGDPVSFSQAWSVHPPAGELFIALGNWDSGVWQWYAPPLGDTVSYPDFDPFIRADNACVAAVAVIGSGAYILDELQIAVQQPPVADLQVDVDNGSAPLVVHFDASGSTDADGSIVDFEWDLDGDGTYNEAGAENGARGASSADYTYNSPGSYPARVRVTDNSAAVDIAQREINVAAGQPPVADLQASDNDGIKPFLVSFDGSASSDPDGTLTDFEWDFDGDGNYNEVNNGENLAQGDSTPPAYTYVSAGLYNAALRVTDNDGNKDVDVEPIVVGNAPPNAVLTADVYTGDAPLAVTYDGSGSNDPGGSIIDYEWDFNANGVYNESGNGENTYRGDPNPPVYTYTKPGTRSPSLRVTDDDGDTDVASVVITAHGWAFTLLNTVDGGIFAAIADIGGHPAICFRDNDATTLHYAYSTTTTGTNAADWTVVEVDNAANSGWRSAMLEVAGSPAILYFSMNEGQLKYARATTATGETAGSWSGTPLNLEAASSTFYGLSLAVVAGNPAAAFFQGNDTSLRYRRASSTTGAALGDWTGGAALSLDGDSGNFTAGEYCSLAVISGNPAIAYRLVDDDMGFTYLRYKRSSTATGAALGDWSGGSTVNVSTGETPYYISLVEAGGNPALAYHDSTGTDLAYRRANTTIGGTVASWTGGTDILLDTTNTSGNYTNLQLLAGRPSVIHVRDTGTRAIRYLLSSTSDGGVEGDWSTDSQVKSDPSPLGEWISYAIVAGRPSIVYRTATASEVEYATLF